MPSESYYVNVPIETTSNTLIQTTTTVADGTDTGFMGRRVGHHERVSEPTLWSTLSAAITEKDDETSVPLRVKGVSRSNASTVLDPSDDVLSVELDSVDPELIFKMLRDADTVTDNAPSPHSDTISMQNVYEDFASHHVVALLTPSGGGSVSYSRGNAGIGSFASNRGYLSWIDLSPEVATTDAGWQFDTSTGNAELIKAQLELILGHAAARMAQAIHSSTAAGASDVEGAVPPPDDNTAKGFMNVAQLNGPAGILKFMASQQDSIHFYLNVKFSRSVTNGFEWFTEQGAATNDTLVAFPSGQNTSGDATAIPPVYSVDQKNPNGIVDTLTLEVNTQLRLSL